MSGQVRLGQVRLGQVRLGQKRCTYKKLKHKVRLSSVWIGRPIFKVAMPQVGSSNFALCQVKLGLGQQVKSGQVMLGQVRLGQVRLGMSRWTNIQLRSPRQGFQKLFYGFPLGCQVNQVKLGQVRLGLIRLEQEDQYEIAKPCCLGQGTLLRLSYVRLGFFRFGQKRWTNIKLQNLVGLS